MAGIHCNQNNSIVVMRLHLFCVAKQLLDVLAQFHCTSWLNIGGEPAANNLTNQTNLHHLATAKNNGPIRCSTRRLFPLKICLHLVVL